MNSEKKLEIAKAKLMLEHPYFGSIASSLKITTNEKIESFQSDGEKFEYNNEYLANLNVDELEFALANSAMHFALSHKERTSQREQWLWQLATDYTINSMLVKNNLFPPERINLDKRFDGLYAEEVYAILESEIDEKDYQESEENRKEGKKEQVTPSEKENKDEDFLNQIHQKMKNQGELPKELKRVFPELFTDAIDWRTQLYRYLNIHAKEDYKFFPPNKKYIHQGIALPSLNSELLKIVVAIDTSGSIDTKLLASFFAHFQSICDSFNSYQIDLISCDAKIQEHRVFYPGDRIEYKTVGGGGTDFRPVFEYVDRYIFDANILIYFTDGLGTFPKTTPSYDTLWVMMAKNNVPFGEVLEITK